MIRTNDFYLNEPGAKNQANGYFFLPNKPDDTSMTKNESIYVKCSILQNVLS